MQLDEIKSYAIDQVRDSWCYSAVEVSTRSWAALHVARRTLRSTLLFTRQVLAACRTLAWPILVTADEFKHYAPCIARVSGPTVAHVQVKNRYRRDRMLRTDAELVLAPLAAGLHDPILGGQPPL